ncbi:hypothetical protein GMOD_00007144 [Pyrenophora seminiperda CCB06]|uniref:Uncharacterized protein n=1 Tax=Pyrenophora seminiperda CCB06 TaxID=1302712 RepID=A0A3M7MCA6_9PLEO|nr:hypothetical protein GMOD_00007144 [Pyrenophora seminiperda CCB06]
MSSQLCRSMRHRFKGSPMHAQCSRTTCGLRCSYPKARSVAPHSLGAGESGALTWLLWRHDFQRRHIGIGEALLHIRTALAYHMPRAL